MKLIFIIAKKELMDLLREKRTLITMIIIPLVIFPLIMTIFSDVSSKQIQKEADKNIQVAVFGKEYAGGLYQKFIDAKNITVIEHKSLEVVDTLVKSSMLDAVITIKPGFDSLVNAGSMGMVEVKHNSTNFGTHDKIRHIIEMYKNNIVNKRMEELGIDREMLSPVNTQYVDVATGREKFGKTVGGMVPYIFLIFSYIGCMYPAIELFTNEKERGTLETILSTPVSRTTILFGKMLVVAIAGLLSALLSILGLSLGLQSMSGAMPDELFGTLSIYSDPSTILLLIFMLVPLVIFIAGIMTLITSYARSYKEAQSMISPLMMIIILPAVLGMMPFIELNAGTALIPITNIALAAKEIISGTLDYGHFSLVILSLFVYAVLGVLASTIWFGKEKSILRT